MHVQGAHQQQSLLLMAGSSYSMYTPEGLPVYKCSRPPQQAWFQHLSLLCVAATDMQDRCTFLVCGPSQGASHAPVLILKHCLGRPGWRFLNFFVFSPDGVFVAAVGTHDVQHAQGGSETSIFIFNLRTGTLYSHAIDYGHGCPQVRWAADSRSIALVQDAAVKGSDVAVTLMTF